MAVQITIIGLGQIGTSVGLALSNQAELIRRVGYDRESKIAQKGKELGAVDKLESNLQNAVREASVVLLALPIDQIKDTLNLISKDLKDGCVVMDTGPVKEVVAAWTGELLPPGRHYVGLTPVLNPAYLHEAESGIEAAHADLFRGGLVAIVATSHTSSEAVKLAADLTHLLGAAPLFIDPAEIDGLMAATHLLPHFLAAALLISTVDQPGWIEGRKVAGRAYAEVSSPIVQLEGPDTLQAAALYNRENVLRVLDGSIAALQFMRDDIEQQDAQALAARLRRAFNGRSIWWQQRQVGDWANQTEASSFNYVPKSSDMFGRLFGIGRKPKPGGKEQK